MHYLPVDSSPESLNRQQTQLLKLIRIRIMMDIQIQPSP